MKNLIILVMCITALPVSLAVADFVSETEISASLDEYVENSFYLSSGNVMENASCSMFRIGEQGDVAVSPYVSSAVIDGRFLYYRWHSNSTIFQEAKSYKVSCNVSVDNETYSNLLQYVYISRDNSLWGYILAIYDYLFNEQKAKLDDINQTLRRVESIVNTTFRVEVAGTEYTYGDTAKAFLQLLDSRGNKVNNSECFLDVWYPNASIWYDDTLMSHADDGLYYKNINMGNISGVYMLTAKCYAPLDFANLLIKDMAVDTFETNSFTGGTGNWSKCNGQPNCQEGWDYEDSVPLTSIVSLGCVQGTYCVELKGSYGFIERGVDIPDGTHKLNITFSEKITGSQTNEHFDFYIFDGNWHLIDAFGTSVTYGSHLNDVWYNLSFELDESAFEFGTGFLIGWYATKDTPSTSDRLYIDNVRIDAIAPNISVSNLTSYNKLEGAGEFHLTGHLSNIQNQIANMTNQLSGINVTATLTQEALEKIRNNTEQIIEQSTISSKTAQIIGRLGKIIFLDAKVWGTEYTYNDSAKVFVQVLANSQPVNNASCYLTTYYPNSTSYFLYNQLMNSTTNGDGIYYYDFKVPSISGVYMNSVACGVPQDVFDATASSYSISIGTYTSGTLADTYFSDNAKLVVATSANKVAMNFNFTNVSADTSQDFELLFEGLLRKTGIGAGTLYFYAYNYNTSSYDMLDNSQSAQVGTDSITLNTIRNSSSYVNQGIVQIMLNASGTSIPELQTDVISLSYKGKDKFIYIGSSGELHITEHLSLISQIRDYISTEIFGFLFSINKSVSNISSVVNENNQLLKNISQTQAINYTPQLNRIEEKLDNISGQVAFDLISR